jgi:hypothetical protein
MKQMEEVVHAKEQIAEDQSRQDLAGWAALMLAAMLSLTACGCASHLQFANRQIAPVASYSHAQTAGGLTMAVDAITNQAEVVRLFGTDLLSSRLLPVLVVASNQNSSLSYLIAPDRFRLLNGKYEAKSNERAKGASMAGAEAAGWTLAVMGIGPTLVVGPFLNAEVHKVKLINQHMRHEQLLQKTLSPGASTSGYLYFAIPQEKKRAPEWTLVFKAKALQTGEELELVFPYNW